MPRRGFGRVGPPVQRLDPHPTHQRGHRSAADQNALGTKQITQHSDAREGAIVMQNINLTHNRKPGQ